MSSGACIQSRTPGMAAREQEFNGHALNANMLRAHPLVSPAYIVAVFGTYCGVRRREVLVKVCVMPSNFFMRFKSIDD